MPEQDIVVIGASAGGVEALVELVGLLPGRLPAALFVVVHFPEQTTSALPFILDRAGPLPAAHPADGEAIWPGRIYVAPPSQHLVFEDGRIRLFFGPREHGFRPAIDPMFRSAAHTHGHRVIGVILSGTLYDGAAGMQAIKRHGGVALVQDPGEALFSGLPRSVIANDHIDYILPVSGIAGKITELVSEPGHRGGRMVKPQNEAALKPELAEEEASSNVVKKDVQAFQHGDESTPRTILSCPDCGGVLWEVHNGKLVRYECQIGHVYNEESLLTEQTHSLEGALWSAVRVLEQHAALTARLAMRAEEQGFVNSAGRFRQNSQESERNADLIRQIILEGSVFGMPLQDLEPGDPEAGNQAGATPSSAGSGPPAS
jgi:two-component system chemotaxis response regulator CheB